MTINPLDEARSKLAAAVPQAFRVLDQIAADTASPAKIRNKAKRDLKKRLPQIRQAAGQAIYSAPDRAFLADLASRIEGW